jgi:hypothetical protein
MKSLEGSIESDSQFIARMGFKPKLPALLLEDLDDQFSHISCSESDMRIVFKSLSQLQTARDAWAKHSSFLVITSHQGCNQKGAHQPHMYVMAMFSLWCHSNNQ